MVREHWKFCESNMTKNDLNYGKNTAELHKYRNADT